MSRRRALWIASGALTFGMLLVEAPFLAHRAGTSEVQRLAVIAAGLGIPRVSIGRLVARRRMIGATRACLAILTAAYLANASICLIVYGEAKFETSSRSGWYLTIAIVWPMALEPPGRGSVLEMLPAAEPALDEYCSRKCRNT
jgi:hypothetical protein